MNISSAVGPIVSVVMFMSLGNSWELSELRRVLIVGVFMSVAAVLSLCLFRDRYSIDPPGTRKNMRTILNDIVPLHDGDDTSDLSDLGNGTHNDSIELVRPSISTSDSMVERRHNGADTQQHVPHDEANNDTETIEDDNDPARDGSSRLGKPLFPCCGLGSIVMRNIALTLGLVDFITAIGAGQTVAFFEIFLQDELEFLPVHVSILTALAAISTGIVTVYGQTISRRIGRVQTILLFRCIGIASLLIFSFMRSSVLVSIVYVMRSAFANASRPLTLSIMMDVVRAKNRGKWSAVESLTMFTWTGSAMLGGFLIERFSYRLCFFITVS
jgi:Major Facilitator Superfamily